MAIYELCAESISALRLTSFAELEIREREDLQRLLRTSIEVVAPDTLVLAEEFGEWEDSKRRIDLLALDRNANLVVIELKRSDDGAHMELQALRYAAMVSSMTFARAVTVYERHLSRNDRALENARQNILDFLGWDDSADDRFGNDVSIILIAANFSKEITTTVMWLNERDLDIRCVRIQPYEFDGHHLIDVQQIVPLPEAADYQVKLKEKAKAKGASHYPGEGKDFTKYDLRIGGKDYPAQAKRYLIYWIVRAAINSGVRREALPLLSGKWCEVNGNAPDAESFVRLMQAQTPGRSFELRRWFIKAEQLFHCGDVTFALSNQWSGPDVLQAIGEIVRDHPNLDISYAASGA